MHLPKVIASDLDGTLLGARGELSERTRKALTAAREYGIAVVAVTARTYYGVDNLAELMPLIDGAVCANGAVFYDPAEPRVDLRHPIAPATARRVAEAVTEALPGSAVSVETGERIIGVRRHYASLVAETSRWTLVDDVDAVFAAAPTIVKLKFYDPALTGEAMAAAVTDSDTAGLDMCHWGEFGMLDFNVEGANKATGLEAWCTERGFTAEDVVAFGDMPVDAPMLRWAGSSYAVDGAHPDAVSAAKDRTAANTDDGVARVVEAIVDSARRAA